MLWTGNPRTAASKRAFASRSLYCSVTFTMSDTPPKPPIGLAKILPPRKSRTPTQRKRAQAKAFRPLAIELGWLTYEWNRLHESLGEIFANVIAGQYLNRGDMVGPALAAWHTLTNERAQRLMLRAAFNSRYLPVKPKPKMHGEISWVLGKLEVLAGKRNDAIHAPLAFINVSDLEAEGVEILPFYFLGNPRATGLKDKSLLEEFKWYRNHLEKLADYAESLIFAMKFSDYTWPDRPQLPPRGLFPSRAAERRKSKSK
jgi:hypothetical protein